MNIRMSARVARALADALERTPGAEPESTSLVGACRSYADLAERWPDSDHLFGCPDDLGGTLLWGVQEAMTFVLAQADETGPTTADYHDLMGLAQVALVVGPAF